MRQVPLSTLRPGHHPDAPPGVCNVRKVGRDAGLDALGASILSLGLLQPLVVVPGGDFFYVVDGNRRHAALESLLAAGKVEADHAVPVIERDAETAREAGLAANITQAPMHEADQMLAFAELRQAGLKEKDIAARFAAPVSQVRKLLALGGVSPAVLDAWRDGKLRIEDVQTFTMAAHADQDRVLAKVLKDGMTWKIREMLGLDADVAHLLSYVGAKAYKAAGGSVVEDLFGSRDAVSDQALIKRLADERLDAECERRRKDGWAWVAKASDLPNGWRWSWPKVQSAERPLTAEDQARTEELDQWLDSDDNDAATDDEIRAAHAEFAALQAKTKVLPGIAERSRSGCVIVLGRDGKVEAVEYVIRPEDVPAVAPKDDKSAEPKEKSLTDALMQRLCEQATRAVQAALPSSPKAALAMLLAGALCEQRGSSTMHIRMEGLDSANVAVKQNLPFETVLAGLLDRTVDELLSVAAVVAARGVSLGHFTRMAPSARPAAQAMMGAIDTAAMTAALGEAFDGEAFFKAIPKGVILSIVGEVLGEAEARRVKDLKKGELVAFAVASVLPTGWLPREIRHPGYAGPGAVEAQPEAEAEPQAIAA
ncbi:ParB/RepB/Spo0J family partition protein [uncultured Methylobacterium sp.]|uniref:ParB/RepB/Spo0J family partition protein n=1 Tax=uncultured Methylobacterium sp. TaxID=157278 RepID=UPI0035CC2C0C